MGFFKQIKDLKETVAAAPGMIDQANQMKANAEAMAAAQQAAAAQAMGQMQATSAAAVAPGRQPSSSGTRACSAIPRSRRPSTPTTRPGCEMGFFGDIAKLSKQAKEIDKTFDPGAQARAATEKMKAMNESMAAATTALTSGIPAKAQIVSMGITAGSMNADPIMPVDLLVMQEGRPPRPVSLSVVVPMSQMYRMIPGTMLAVRISETDADSVAIDWAAPV